MKIYVFPYNNYYNRKIKPPIAYADLPAGKIQSGSNFAPLDGVTSSIIVNTTNTNFDYCAIAEESTIVSRWFIVEKVQTCFGQYKCILQRDLLSDFYNDILTKTHILCEKGAWLDLASCYNKEPISTNKIKTKEFPLKDATGSAWVVGYLAPPTEDITITFNTSVDTLPTITSSQYNALTALDEKFDTKAFDGRIKFYLLVADYGHRYFEYSTANRGFVHKDEFTLPTNLQHGVVVLGVTDTQYRRILLNCESFNIGDEPLATLIGHTPTIDTYTSVPHKFNYSGVAYEKPSISECTQSIVETSANTTITQLSSVLELNASVTYTLEMRWYRYHFEITTLPTSSYTLTIPANAKMCSNAPYLIFTYPLESLSFQGSGINFVQSIDPIKLASALSNQLSGGGKLYDIQIIPYCPIMDKWSNDHIIVPASGSGDERYSLIKDGNSADKGIVFYLGSNQFSNQLVTLTGDEFVVPTEAIAWKKKQICDSFRYVSPSGSATFDIDILKFDISNSGNIKRNRADVTLYPYKPYIRVYPEFNGLYGAEFGDYRGLVLNDDFSLPQVSDAWNTYVINNKNYQNTFNRNLESMELAQKTERRNELFGIGTTALQSGASGAKLGSAGGPGAMGAGALVGAAIGAATAAIDTGFNDILRADELSRAKDLFNYNLENIQALPDRLTNIGCLYSNFKIFPYIEYYTCTTEEKRIVEQELKWNGCTVNRPARLDSVVKNDVFVRGVFLRYEGGNLDAHELAYLAKELMKGVYYEI